MNLIKFLDVVSGPIRLPGTDKTDIPLWVYLLIILGSAALLIGISLLIHFLTHKKK